MADTWNPDFLNTTEEAVSAAAEIGLAPVPDAVDTKGLDQPIPDAPMTEERTQAIEEQIEGKRHKGKIAPPSPGKVKDKTYEYKEEAIQEYLPTVTKGVAPPPNDAVTQYNAYLNAGGGVQKFHKKPGFWETEVVPRGQYLADKWADGWVAVTRGKAGYDALKQEGMYEKVKNDYSKPALMDRQKREKTLESKWAPWDPARVFGAVVEATPVLGETLAAGAAGAASGGAIGAALASIVPGAGTAGGAVVGATMGARTGIFLQSGRDAAGQTYMDLRDSGIKHQTAQQMALASGTINGLLNTLGVGQLGNAARRSAIKQLQTPAGRAAAHKLIVGFAKELGIQVGYGEASTAVDLAAKTTASLIDRNKKAMPTADEVKDAIIKSAGQNAIVGAAFIGASHGAGAIVGGAGRKVAKALDAQKANRGLRAEFDAYIGGHINREGGLANNPADPGGATKYGISYNNNAGRLRKYGINGPGDMHKLTIPQAKEIYYNAYFVPSGAGKIKDRAAREMYLDAALGPEGPGGARKILARAGGEGATVDSVAAARLKYLKSMKNWGTFGEGWTNRIGGLQRQLKRKGAKGGMPDHFTGGDFSSEGPKPFGFQKPEQVEAPRQMTVAEAYKLITGKEQQNKLAPAREISIGDAFRMVDEGLEKVTAKEEGLPAGLEAGVSKPKLSESKYTPEVQKALNAKKLEYEQRVQMLKESIVRDDTQKSKELKGLAMRNAAETRAIIQGDSLERIPGGLTDIELATKVKREATNYQGKNVVDTTTGEVGQVERTAFGKVRVRFGDEIRSVDPDNISPAPKNMTPQEQMQPVLNTTPPPSPIGEPGKLASDNIKTPKSPFIIEQKQTPKNAEKTQKLWDHFYNEAQEHLGPEKFQEVFGSPEVVARVEKVEEAAHGSRIDVYETAIKAAKTSEKAALQRAALKELETAPQVKQSLQEHFKKMRGKEKISADDMAKLKEELKDLNTIKQYCKLLGYL